MRRWLLACGGMLACTSALAAQELPQGGFRLPPPAVMRSALQTDADTPAEQPPTDEAATEDDADEDTGPQPWRLFPPERTSPWEIGGWVQSGYHEHANPLAEVFGDGQAFNDAPHQLNLHQSWLYLERTPNEECDLDWGFRADVIYGIDAQDTQGFGSNGWDTSFDHGIYGWAIPQTYFVIAWDKLQIKAGHFFTLLGYEAVAAPDNFFYSHSLTNFNTEPFTHTGALATYTVNDQLDVVVGWINGWDSGLVFSNGANAGLTGFQWTPVEPVQFAYYNTFGAFGNRGNNGYSHSLVMQIAASDKLKYVLQSDLLDVEEPPMGSMSGRDDDIGLNQYLIYDYCECVKLGARMEWWKCDGVSFQEVTAGINWLPNANLRFRPELRYDWSTGAQLERTTFAIDAIFSF